MKEWNKAKASDLGKTDISNMPEREFKTMNVRIFSGLEKRVKDKS